MECKWPRREEDEKQNVERRTLELCWIWINFICVKSFCCGGNAAKLGARYRTHSHGTSSWNALTSIFAESVHLSASHPCYLRPVNTSLQSYVPHRSTPPKKTPTLRAPYKHHREIGLLRWSPALGRNCTPMCNLELQGLQEWYIQNRTSANFQKQTINS